MSDFKLTASFLMGTVLFGMPLAFAILFVVSLFIPSMSYIELLSSSGQVSGYAAIVACVIGLMIGIRLSLNFTVRLNAKYKWCSESAIKAKMGKALQRWVFVKYS